MKIFGGKEFKIKEGQVDIRVIGVHVSLWLD
jgi:hypothetical protein